MITVRRYIGEKEVTKEELHTLFISNPVIESIYETAKQRIEKQKSTKANIDSSVELCYNDLIEI